MSGTVTNNMDVPVRDLTVILTYYDSAGTVVDEGQVGITGPVDPGVPVNFDTVANNPDWDGVNWAAMTEALTPAVSLTPSLTFAGQIRETTSGPMTATVSNVGTGDLHIGALSFGGSDPGNFATTADTCSNTVVAPSASCTTGVTFTPNDVRAFSAVLQVPDEVSGSPQTVSLAGNGLTRAAISAAPSPLVFGNQLLATSSNKTITLSSTGLTPNGDATITGVGLDSTADFRVDASGCPSPPAKLAAGSSCPIVVTFAPSAVGLRSTTLNISATDDGSKAAKNSPLHVTVQGTGTRATATVSPTALAFGSVNTGASSAGKTVTLTSTGSGPLQIASITLTGANASEFSREHDCPTPGSLASGSHCTITVRFSPQTSGDKSASLTIADNASGGNQVVPLTGKGILGTSFYFAEGFTGAGFQETLSILTPSQSGTATIDYYTEQGHQPTVVRSLTAGHVLLEDVNADVGANHQVSARVILSVPGVVERVMHFNNGTWLGSTDKVGAPAPATSWYFAEGSTLSAFAEYLSIQNPNSSEVVVDLTYATDRNQHPVKTLMVPANTRITVVVGLGNLFDNANCAPLVSCGVGGGVVGVSVQVKSRTLPIVAERPMYVMHYNFGYGPIADGHDALGANAPSTTWNFAEGTTLAGFNEYLTLQNPGLNDASVTLTYLYDLGTKTVTVNVPKQSRVTALVFDASNLGVGRGYVGVSTAITSTEPIVAERPMYMYFNFGTGPVAGAHVVVGATGLGTLFGFAAASTAVGENDYLTIQNSGALDANVTVDYYTTGAKVTKQIVVTHSTRRTVLVFSTTGGGLGPGFSPLGIVVSSDKPVLVEKPTYSSNLATYGATDTTGYTPAGAF